MTPEKLALIGDLRSEKITPQYFLELFNKLEGDIHKLIVKSLRQSLKEKDSDLLSYTISLFQFDKEFKNSNDILELLNVLLVEDWHIEHESIASLLKGFKSPSSIDYLYSTAIKDFEYLAYDDAKALAKKCIYALYAIDSSESNEAIRKLINSPYAPVAELAERKVRW